MTDLPPAGSREGSSAATEPKFGVRLSRGVVSYLNDEPLMTWQQADEARQQILDVTGESGEVVYDSKSEGVPEVGAARIPERAAPFDSGRALSAAFKQEDVPELLREYAERKTGYIYADEVAVLQAAADEIDRLRAKLAEYDKYVAEFTNGA